jgi:vesicle-fusing ATPase
MEMGDTFDSDIYVPNITDLNQLQLAIKVIMSSTLLPSTRFNPACFQDLQLFTPSESVQAISQLQRFLDGKKLSIGIKKLLMVTEMARQDVDKLDKFVNTIIDTSVTM